ncbi:helix-turn-helix transcriptional regulator [Escherichia coli]|uniref:helix-turn-helix transcriptional regulator n=1 Tax=Escherichia coli TaxID=562 RepID=UPI000246EAA0|nr:helix-turn-helix transcriptional regulator [Escherichia coli]EHN94229.1 hypothetical protein ESOG_04689 [Escherichia coli E101]
MNSISIRDTMNNSDTLSISIQSITTNKYLIVYTDNCELTIEKNNEVMFFPKDSIVFIERGIRFSCKIKKQNQENAPFRVIRLDREELVMLKNVFKSTYSYRFDDSNEKRKPQNKIIGVKESKSYIQEFKRIASVKDSPLKILNLAYIVSRMKMVHKIMMSLVVSAATTFTDKVKCIIESNTSKRWRLNMIADEFNISEISVRKRLESEGASFNNLLLEIRMNKAMQLLLENEKQIHQISKEVGIFSPSYFIRNFKTYFGITPKQFVIYFRC